MSIKLAEPIIARAHATFRRGELRQDGIYVRDGLIATQTEVEHWIYGVGRGRVRLRIDEEIMSEWRAAGVESLPLMRDHGMSGDFWSVPGIEHRLGRIEGLRLDTDSRGLPALGGEFLFDPDLCGQFFGPIQRGIMREVSVQFRVHELVLIEDIEGQMPLYEARHWTPVEGSLVWAGADPVAVLRSKNTTMNFQDLIKRAIEEFGAEAASELIARSQGNAAKLQEIMGERRTALSKPLAAAAPQVATLPPLDLSRSIKDAVAEAMATQAAATTNEPATGARAYDLLVDAAITEVGAQAAAELIARSQGNAAVLGGLLRAAKAAKAVADVPATTGNATLPITGGDTGSQRCLQDLVTVTCARANRDDQPLREQAAKVGQDWRRMSTAYFVHEFLRSRNPSAPRPTALSESLRDLMRERATGDGIIAKDGGRYRRDASMGLVPADLSSAFLDVIRKSLMGSYEKHMWPMERVAIIEDTVDFRTKRMIWVDVAGQWQSLAKNEPLRPLSLRELEGQFRPQVYGYIHKVGYEAIIDDDLGVLARVPGLIGQWGAAGETFVLQTAIINGQLLDGTSVYTGNNDLDVADPSDFATHWETVRRRALASIPVPAKSDEDPRNTPLRTEALVPTVMVYGTNLYQPLHIFGSERQMRTFDTPANTIRNDYEQTLYRNSYQGLYLPESNMYVYPGPETGFCPVVVGHIIGQEMRVEVAETGPYEMDGLIVRMTNTFGATMSVAGKAYRIR